MFLFVMGVNDNAIMLEWGRAIPDERRLMLIGRPFDHPETVSITDQILNVIEVAAVLVLAKIDSGCATGSSPIFSELNVMIFMIFPNSE